MKPLYTFLGLVLLVSTVQAGSVTTIQLQNRPAEEVIPIVEPMLGSDDAISGQGFKMFLRSSPETVARVKNMVAVLDIPARILQISVFQGGSRELGKLGVDAIFQIENGEAGVSIGSGSTNDGDSGGGVTYSTDTASGTIDSVSTGTRLRDTPVHQVRVTEGSEAYIETGEHIPYFVGGNWIRPRGVAGGVEYREVTTGFYVLPRVHGDNVRLQVSPFRNSQTTASGVNIETQSANTTVIGPLGEWLLIGGATGQIKRSESRTGSYVSTQNGDGVGTWIKADLVQ